MKTLTSAGVPAGTSGSGGVANRYGAKKEG
jgi:hypothetical protein